MVKLSNYETEYKLVKSFGGDYTTLLPPLAEISTQPETLQSLRRRCEMVLVREFDDWYVGSPLKNISQAIHIYVSRFQNPKNDLLYKLIV